MNGAGELQQINDKIQELTKSRLGTTDEPHTTVCLLMDQYLRRAMLYRQKGDIKAAMADYEEAIFTGSSYAKVDDSIKKKTAEASIRKGFLECQQDECFKARIAFESALAIDSNAKFIFARLQQEDKENITANIFEALYGLSSEGGLISEELLHAIRADCKGAYHILSDWELMYYREISKINDMIIALLGVVYYESKGEFGVRLRTITILPVGQSGICLPQDWLSLEPKSPSEIGPLRLPLLNSLYARKHPVGIVGLGCYYAQWGDIIGSVSVFAELGKQYPGFVEFANGRIAEILERNPNVIQQHMERKDFQNAAALAGYAADYTKAGECYELAAQELENNKERITDSVESIAYNYETAAECWEKAGNPERAATCWQNVRRLRQEPELEVVIDAPERFVLGEWDAFNIAITNKGFGSAQTINVKIEGPVTQQVIGEIKQISAGEKGNVEIAVRPNEVGRRVPITILINYQDETGIHDLSPLFKVILVTRPQEL